MQDRYVGDVGDFGKYGLLRALAPDLALGVVWYLVPNESHNADGKHISYLRPSRKNSVRFRNCSPRLYDALAEIVEEENRSVESIQKRGVLPEGSVFYADRLTYAGLPPIGPSARDTRLNHRKRWVEQALHMTRDTDIVFLDPDNGLECKTEPHHSKGPKYVYFDEVQPHLNRGQSVVIYHHLDRSFSAGVQIELQFARLRDRLGGCQQMSALHYHRGSARAFFVIPAPAHEALLNDRIHRFIDGPWSQHFDYVCAPS
jgi:hypothetical protein